MTEIEDRGVLVYPVSEPVPPQEPRMTIRVGTEMFEDVLDYVVLVRDKNNEVRTLTSSYCWADGAMRKTLCVIDAHNDHSAHEDCDEE